jgi:hypothetical protein
MKKQLHDEFDNGEPEHFTNYDYVLQVSENGQLSAFKLFIKQLDHEALVHLAVHQEFNHSMLEELRAEILRRMNK